MKARRAEFLTSASEPRGFPRPDLPEIAIAGRSNVGKSSLINTLVGVEGLARTSRTPGRTRLLNWFRVEPVKGPAFALVDLPGYGYARISKARQAEWLPLIEGYLRASPELRGVVQLLDVRHDPTGDDAQMIDFLAEIGAPTVFVATKIDKLAKRAVAERVAALAERIGAEVEQIIPFSAVTGEGRDELAEAIVGLVGEPSWRAAALAAAAEAAGVDDDGADDDGADDDGADDDGGDDTAGPDAGRDGTAGA